ncbi:esterase/lipase family protein [Marinobacter lacisalsi]|uniref:Esterase/lipase family protein n=1 Tax=Marinobacter lacisalsi TaxID=475979 RepID=A0ABV8QC74_9GAMM
MNASREREKPPAHDSAPGKRPALQPSGSADLIGTSRLILDGFNGVTDVVESMHRNIAGLAPIVGEPRPGPTRGISGLVYRNIRRVSSFVGLSLDVSLQHLSPLLPDQSTSQGREMALSVLNGVLGDYLVASDNPLAIPTQLRSDGVPLALMREALGDTFPQPTNRVVVLVHGLCRNDLHWQRNEHDYGEALARDLGYTPLYLRYNSGRPVTDNGRDFAAVLEKLVSEWPVPLDELVLVGHSMGGLVSRSACRWGQEAGHQWPGRLRKMVFLGTPHHGSALERLGNRFESFLGISPYSAPIGRIGKIRSAGIKDLREGNIGGEAQQATGQRVQPVPLPRDIRCYAIAASTGSALARLPALEQGDGLVRVTSALGQHEDGTRALGIPSSRQAVFHGLNHFDLLGHQQVYDRLLLWLDEH